MTQEKSRTILKILCGRLMTLLPAASRLETAIPTGGSKRRLWIISSMKISMKILRMIL